MYKFWSFHDTDEEFMIDWPTLMLLCQAILVIPTSTDICERAFQSKFGLRASKKKWTQLVNLDTTDALMRISLNSLGV